VHIGESISLVLSATVSTVTELGMAPRQTGQPGGPCPRHQTDETRRVTSRCWRSLMDDADR